MAKAAEFCRARIKCGCPGWLPRAGSQQGSQQASGPGARTAADTTRGKRRQHRHRAPDRLCLPVQILWLADGHQRNLLCRSRTSSTASMPAMIRINQTLQSPVNCLYQTVTAGLCSTSDQEAKSILNHALGITEIRDYTPEIDVLVVETKASTVVLTYFQASANLQSP